jgi:hypothetical protein
MKKVHPVAKQLTSRRRDTAVVWDAAVGRYGWKRLGLREYRRWQSTIAQSAVADFSGGSECIQRHAQSTWWTWDNGSRPFFWRWPPEYLAVIWDGLPIHMLGTPPLYDKPQDNEHCKETRAKVRENLQQVQE